MSKKTQAQLVLESQRAHVALELMGPALTNDRNNVIASLKAHYIADTLTHDRALALVGELIVLDRLESKLRRPIAVASRELSKGETDV